MQQLYGNLSRASPPDQTSIVQTFERNRSRTEARCLNYL